MALAPDGYRILAGEHLIPIIGATKLKKLTADDVHTWLDGLTSNLSTRSLQAIHSTLKRAIRQAQVRDKVGRNVAELVTTPTGRKGGPAAHQPRPGHRLLERPSGHRCTLMSSSA